MSEKILRSWRMLGSKPADEKVKHKHNFILDVVAVDIKEAIDIALSQMPEGSEVYNCHLREF